MVSRCTWAVHVCATIPARVPILCTYRMHVCPHVRYVQIIPALRRAEFQRDTVKDDRLLRNVKVACRIPASSRNGKNSTLACKPKPAEFIQQ